jgi:hypothetical protein
VPSGEVGSGGIIVYSKPGCPLCDEGFEKVKAVAARFHLTVTKVDILSHPNLEVRHGERIPVVELNGDGICWGRISEQRLAREIEKRLPGSRTLT